MTVKIKTSEGQPSQTPSVREKSRRGRPLGRTNTSPPKARSAWERRVQQFRRQAKLPVAAAKIQEQLQKTATMTDEQLLEAARSVPEARGGYSKGVDGITDELAERVALAYRLMIRGLSITQIAEQMDVSEHTAKDYIERVKQMLKLDPKNLDVGYYMGETMAFFQEVRQMALLHASHGGNSVNEKLGAMKLALEAEVRKNEFLQRIGVYSPTVIERIERWLVNTTEHQIAESPVKAKKVNLAAEIGRVLANQGRVPALVDQQQVVVNG